MNPVIAASNPQLKVASPYLPWLVCFSAAFFFLFEFMQVNMFNAITPSLMKEFSLSAAQVGQLSAGYFYATIIFVLPAGMILDRVSTRKVIMLAMISSVLSAYIFAFANAAWLVGICRFVTGIGGSFCLLSCIRLASRWFPPRRLALIIGLIVTMAMIGGMLAQTPMTLLTDNLGWRDMLLIDATVGLAMILLIYIYVQDTPEVPVNNHTPHAPLSWSSFFLSVRKSLTNPQNWLGGFYTSLLNLPIMLMGAMWGSLYLVQVHGLTRTEASWVTSMIFFGTILGSPFIGWFSDRLGLRRIPMLLCASLALIISLMIILLPLHSTGLLMTLFFLLGFVTSGQILSYPLIAESNPRALTGTAEGIASTLIMAGGISQPLFGLLMGLNWNHQMVNNLPYYSHTDFLTAMALMPIASILGLVAAWFVRETHCKPQD